MFLSLGRFFFFLVYSLCKLNYLFLFKSKQFFIKLNNSFIYSRSLIDSLYHVSSLSVLPSNENYLISHKRKEPHSNQTQLWHLHLGHVNVKMTKDWLSLEFYLL